MTLREEFIVCYAAGYPDPMRFDTLREAQAFAGRHTYNHSTRKVVQPEIKRRMVTDYETVEVVKRGIGSALVKAG